MASESLNNHHNNLHFLLVPYLSYGHLIPMADIARLLSQHGVTVTIVTTPLNAKRIKPIIELSNSSSNTQIKLIQIQFPVTDFGLPQGCESMELIPSKNLLRNFHMALGKLKEPIEDLIEELKPTPTCIIVGKFITWLDEVAEKFQIPRIICDGTSCINHLLVQILHDSKVHENFKESHEHFLVPNTPHKIEITRSQLPMDLNPPDVPEIKFAIAKVRASEESAYGVLINTFEELEFDYVRSYKKTKEGKSKVWCIGPVSLSYKGLQDAVQRGDKAKFCQEFFMNWLDSKPEKSVVYVCLGTLSNLPLSQFQELAMALEDSKFPFILVMREDECTGKAKKWLLEDGFEDRNKEKGLIIHGWVPQVLIFSHKAIGAFLTHCGWNSTLEGICAGIPMITWPMFVDQFFNEKLIVEILRVGESLGNDVSTMPIGEQEENNNNGGSRMIKREDIVEAIEKVVGEGIDDEKEERRERVRKLGVLAKKSMEYGGSSYLNMEMLIDDIAKVALDKLTQ